MPEHELRALLKKKEASVRLRSFVCCACACTCNAVEQERILAAGMPAVCVLRPREPSVPEEQAVLCALLPCFFCVERLQRLTVLASPNRGQDFEKAGELRDKEMELKAKISAITGAAKEEEDAEQVGCLDCVVPRGAPVPRGRPVLGTSSAAAGCCGCPATLRHAHAQAAPP